MLPPGTPPPAHPGTCPPHGPRTPAGLTHTLGRRAPSSLDTGPPPSWHPGRSAAGCGDTLHLGAGRLGAPSAGPHGPSTSTSRRPGCWARAAGLVFRLFISGQSAFLPAVSPRSTHEPHSPTGSRLSLSAPPPQRPPCSLPAGPAYQALSPLAPGPLPAFLPGATSGSSPLTRPLHRPVTHRTGFGGNCLHFSLRNPTPEVR